MDRRKTEALLSLDTEHPVDRQVTSSIDGVVEKGGLTHTSFPTEHDDPAHTAARVIQQGTDGSTLGRSSNEFDVLSLADQC